MKRPGTNRKKVLRFARSLGVQIRKAKGSELLLTHEAVDHPMVVCGHKKGVPRCVLTWLKRVQAALEPQTEAA